MLQNSITLFIWISFSHPIPHYPAAWKSSHAPVAWLPRDAVTLVTDNRWPIFSRSDLLIQEHLTAYIPLQWTVRRRSVKEAKKTPKFTVSEFSLILGLVKFKNQLSDTMPITTKCMEVLHERSFYRVQPTGLEITVEDLRHVSFLRLGVFNAIFSSDHWWFKSGYWKGSVNGKTVVDCWFACMFGDSYVTKS